MARIDERTRDERDLAILALASIGITECEIARQLRCSRRTVRRVIQADAREFADDPLPVRFVAPMGAC